MTESDRKRSFRIYEPERVEIDSRYAFMTHLNPERSLFFNTPKKPNLLNARMTNIDKAYRNSKPRPATEPLNKNSSEDSMNTFDYQSNLNFHSFRSLKEFSYFDWSKVKLMKNKYELNEASPFNIYHKNDLSLVRSSRTTRPNTHNFDILDNKTNELPQVVTIRFTWTVLRFWINLSNGQQKEIKGIWSFQIIPFFKKLISRRNDIDFFDRSSKYVIYRFRTFFFGLFAIYFFTS